MPLLSGLAARTVIFTPLKPDDPYDQNRGSEKSEMNTREVHTADAMAASRRPAGASGRDDDVRYLGHGLRCADKFFLSASVSTVSLTSIIR